MAKIITENFKIENTNELFDSLDDQNYYVVASRAITRTEAQVTPSIQNTQVSKRDFLRKVIFGRKLSTDNARYMFVENPWVKGTIYDQFDDTQDIETLNMIVTIQEEGKDSYLVYKCLDNNNGTQSQEIPGVVDPTNYQRTKTQDGYTWQFMFRVLPVEVADFKTADNLPLPVIEGGYGDKDVKREAKENVSNIIIEDTIASQFNQYLFGESTNISNTSDVIVVDPDTSSLGEFRNITVRVTAKTGRLLYSAPDAYKNMYLKHGTTGKLYDVVASTSSPQINQITLRIKSTDLFLAQQVCQLLIKVNVSSSSLVGERAKAYLELDEFGTAKRVSFETRGDGYKSASAQVVYPPLLKNSASVLNNPTLLRAIVSPKGGHGSDPISEMAMSKLAITSTIVGTSLFTPDVNFYSTLGLVKNPTFVDANGASVTPDEFDNRTILTVSGDHIDNSGDEITADSPSQTIHKLLQGGGGVDSYVEQFIKTISVQEMVDGVSYTIVDMGTENSPAQMEQNDFTAIGASGDNIGVGTVFTSTNTASISSIKDGKVSFVTDRVDVTSSTYDYSLDIVTAKIHEITSDDNNTYIHLVDYDGDFEHKFQKGIFYIKQTESATVSINNKTTNTISYGQYDAYSGDLLHFIDFTPINRSPTRNENIKFTFDF